MVLAPILITKANWTLNSRSNSNLLVQKHWQDFQIILLSLRILGSPQQIKSHHWFFHQNTYWTKKQNLKLKPFQVAAMSMTVSLFIFLILIWMISRCFQSQIIRKKLSFVWLSTNYKTIIRIKQYSIWQIWYASMLWKWVSLKSTVPRHH